MRSMINVNHSRRGFFGLLTAGSVAAVGLAAPPNTKDTSADVPLDKVPGAVRKAADKAVSKAKWIGATKNTEDGETTYELDGTDSKGREVTVVVAPDGTVHEIEKEIPMKEVPKVVTEALKKKLADFKATLAHSVTEEGKIVAYSFEGKRSKDKEEVDVTVAADASSVDIDDD
jgi:Rieske Fe-S protein